MEENEEKEPLTPLQELRNELSGKLRHLPDYKIIELCADYGITYDLADVNTLRLFMLLCAAEELSLSERRSWQ